METDPGKMKFSPSGKVKELVDQGMSEIEALELLGHESGEYVVEEVIEIEE